MKLFTRPLYDGALSAYCGPCKTRTPHLKTALPGQTYESTVCLQCHPEILDNTDSRLFTYLNFTFGEFMRLSRLRERWLQGDTA